MVAATSFASKNFVFDPGKLPLFNIMRRKMSDIFSRSSDDSEAAPEARLAAQELRDKIKLIKCNINHIFGLIKESNAKILTYKIKNYIDLIAGQYSEFEENVIKKYGSIEKFSNSDEKDPAKYKTIKNLAADFLTLKAKIENLIEILKETENEDGYVFV